MMLEPWTLSLSPMWQNVVHGGYLAVGTFFVLSGFVLGQSYSSASWDRRSLLRYCAARCARVYPVYALSLLVMIPFIASELMDPVRTGVELSQKAGLLANYGLVLQGWFLNLPVHWNTPAWSLSCEFFFYLCFPVAAFLLRGAGWLRLGLLTLLALALPNLLSALHVSHAFKPLYHVGDFLIGIVAARLYCEVLRGRFHGLGYWLYIPAAVAGFLIVSTPTLVPHHIMLNSALRPFNALLLTGLALGGGFPVTALSTSVAGFLGRASYSMYILHIPMLWWFKRFFTGIGAPNVMALIYIGGVIAVSGWVCERVEEPASKRIRDWVSLRLRPSVRRSEV